MLVVVLVYALGVRYRTLMLTGFISVDSINWTTSFFIGAFHVGAVAALFFFTWKAFAVAVVLWSVAGSLGISMGYYRLLRHRAALDLADPLRPSGNFDTDRHSGRAFSACAD